MAERHFVERVWWGSDPTARLVRGALAPAALLYRGVVAARGALYDAGLLPSRATALPAVSVGNLSVGGTGKTPIAAWIAAQLRERGARPAVVLRGYGGDEPIVHSTLNPDVPVVISPDRVRGAARARVLGANVVVLDDAFQHRRARRAADIVLVSADRWTSTRRLLPAGPWREPLDALRRASLVVVTRKAASASDVARVVSAVEQAAPAVPYVVVHLAPGGLRAANGPSQEPLDALRGATIHAIAAIGDPHAFVRQLTAAGAKVRASLFPDHYQYTHEDALRLALDGGRSDLVVCTLKDAVKLGPLWPREAPPLWYVSQQVVVEHGRGDLERLLDGLRTAAPPHRDTAGPDRPNDSPNGH